MIWDEAADGIPFGVLCSMLATYDGVPKAPPRAARAICTAGSRRGF